MNQYINIFMQREAGCIWDNCYMPSKTDGSPSEKTLWNLSRSWNTGGWE